MKLVEEPGELKGIKPDLIIITGDGRTELKVMRVLSKKYDGESLILFFPFSKLSRKSGLTALDVIKDYPGIYGICSFIYIVDGDTFDGKSARTEIENYLINKIGINISNITPIQDAFLIECNFGSYNNIEVYCIICGPEACIEEEAVRLISLTLRKEIDLTGDRDKEWRKRIKNEIVEVLRENQIKKFEHLLEKTGISKIEEAFPNFCAILRKIEEDFNS